MKTSSPHQKPVSGFVLIVMMAALTVILIVFAGVMYWISSNGSQMQRNQIFMASEAAAEGATEMAYAQMDQDFLYQSLNSSGSAYSVLVPNTTNWPVQYTFNTTVTIGQQSGALQYIGSQYTNLLGYAQTNTITCTATPVGQMFSVPATVSQQVIFASVPAFQYAVFYNVDLDMSPGSAMSINGATFCNHNIWCYPGGQMTFNGVVEAAGNFTFHWDTNGDESGNITGSPLTPVYNEGTPISHVNPLVLPIGAGSPTNNNPTNVEAIINLPPAAAMAPQAIAYTLTNQVYDFNAASLIVSNWANGTNRSKPIGNNFTVYLQDSAVSGSPYYVTSNGIPMRWIQMTNDFYVYTNNYYKTTYPTNYVPNFNFANVNSIQWIGSPQGTNTVIYAGFSFLTNTAFTDYRESATVQAVQIDVSQLRAWVTNTGPNGGNNWNFEMSEDLSHGINSIFVYNDVPFIGESQLPAVCMVNGTRLPNSTNTVNGTNCITSGLTVVTPHPVYVIGNYNVQIDGSAVVVQSHNTADTYPAAFLADSITVLSSNWPSDWNQTSYGNRVAANDTVNAGCLEGIVLSTGGQNNGGDGSGAEYSGGIENFLRLLETWGSGSTTLTYNGSIIVMFPSVYATNVWQLPGNYYDKPARDWGFDTNFEVQIDLPPLTPAFRTVVRSTWVGN
jgi:type II secretory pathway pseudopilin PulG